MNPQSEARAHYFRPGSELYQRAMELMMGRIDSGQRVVIGAWAGELGQPIGRAGDRVIVIDRRATRDDFLLLAPGRPVGAEHARAPFYWELAVKNASEVQR